MDPECQKPLRFQGILPVPNDWSFKCMPRWKRALAIERAFLADEAARAARLRDEEGAEEDNVQLVVADNIGSPEELQAAIRRASSLVLIKNCFPAAAHWKASHRPGSVNSWSFVARKPTKVLVRKHGQTASSTLWPGEFVSELERELNEVVRGDVLVRIKSGAQKHVLTISVISSGKVNPAQ